MTRARIPGAGRNGIVPRSAYERLLSRLSLQEGTGCAVWTGALDRKGYARIAVGGHRNRMAHRVAYEAAKGPIPDGLGLDHLCRNKACCNPDHLEPVTSAENTSRANAARAVRTECRYGHPYTEESTWIDKRGVRHCKPCRRDRQRRSRDEPSSSNLNEESQTNGS